MGDQEDDLRLYFRFENDRIETKLRLVNLKAFIRVRFNKKLYLKNFGFHRFEKRIQRVWFGLIPEYF